MGAVSSTVNAVVDVVEDVGSTIDDIVIQPAIDVVEGSIDLSKNSLTTAADVTQSLLQGDFSTAEDQLKSGVNNIDNILSETYMDIRDPLEAAAVIGGNYLLPGSSMVTSQLVSEGAQDILGSKGGQTLNFAAGATGGYQGNTANYGKIGESFGGTPTDPNVIDLGGGVTINPDGSVSGGTFSGSGDSFLGESGGFSEPATAGSQVTADQITSDIAGDNIDAGGGWSPATDATPAELEKARAVMASNGITFKQALDGIRAGLFINSITGDPLGLSDSGVQQGASGPTGFDVVPIPADWKSPTYAAPSAPIDLESIFSNQNMLGGTQWQNLATFNPQGTQWGQNVSFNDIFANTQPAPIGQPVDINQIVNNISGGLSGQFETAPSVYSQPIYAGSAPVFDTRDMMKTGMDLLPQNSPQQNFVNNDGGTMSLDQILGFFNGQTATG